MVHINTLQKNINVFKKIQISKEYVSKEVTLLMPRGGLLFWKTSWSSILQILKLHYL
jgi:hypothetical protein